VKGARGNALARMLHAGFIPAAGDTRKRICFFFLLFLPFSSSFFLVSYLVQVPFLPSFSSFFNRIHHPLLTSPF
jgi:hypothetical protein